MDSLIISDGVTSLELIPLLGSGSVGWHLEEDYSFGDPQVQTASIRSALVDGSPTVGRASGNRSFPLGVVVVGQTRDDLTVKDNTVRTIMNRSSWTMTWTPDDGLPVVFDCFRAQPEGQWDQKTERFYARVIRFTFEALPFGRNPSLSLLNLAVQATSTHWNQYRIRNFEGNARAPLSVTATLPSTETFSGMVLHSPPPSADPLIRKSFPLSTGYPHTATAVSAVDHPFAGTYTAIAVVNTFGDTNFVQIPTDPTFTQVVTVTVTEKIEGITTGTAIVTRAFSPNLGYGYYYPVGNITLPLVANQNPSTLTYDVVVTASASQPGGTATKNTYNEILWLDTAGKTVLIPQLVVDEFGARTALYDEVMVQRPSPLQSVGNVLLRPQGTSALLSAVTAVMSGGAFAADPAGDVRPDGTYAPAPLFAHHIGDPPLLAGSYFPAWEAERENIILPDPPTATYLGGNSNALTSSMTVPFTAAPAGQTLLAAVSHNLATVGTPSGWTRAAESAQYTDYSRVALFTKTSLGTETSVTFTLTPAGGYSSAYWDAAVVGVDGTLVATTTTGQNSAISVTTTVPTAPSNAREVVFVTDYSSNPFALDPSLTVLASLATTQSAMMVGTAPVGFTTTRTHTRTSGGSRSWAAVSAALTP